MTAKAIKKICIDNNQYSTPYLNEKLYLHRKVKQQYLLQGFLKIENLDEYTGVKCIFLEGNGLNKIEGLSHMKDLSSLYFSHN